jgi:hypothetical protein
VVYSGEDNCRRKKTEISKGNKNEDKDIKKGKYWKRRI